MHQGVDLRLTGSQNDLLVQPAQAGRKTAQFAGKQELAKIVLAYVVLAGLWIYASDTLLSRWVSQPQRAAFWSTAKGWLFVAVTAALLWVMLWKLLRRLSETARQAEHTQRLYAALSRVNQANARATSAEVIYQEVCEALVRVGNFRMAWIGLADAATHQITPVVSAGDLGNYLKQLRITSDAEPEQSGPAVRAFQQGRMIVLNDLAGDGSSHPWHELAVNQGYRSIAALPFRSQGQPCGVLAAYAAEAGFFREEELGLLGQMAEDVSCTLDRLKGEEHRLAAEEKIREFNAELEQRVKNRTAQLEAANKELEAFSYSVSHDLRAPLRAVDGYSSILAEQAASQLDAENQRMLRQIRKETARMSRLIDDLLAFSRLNRCAMRAEQIDLTELARNTFAQCAKEAGQMTVQFNLAPLSPAHVDAALMRQALSNLFSNALKYTRPVPQPQIEMGCRPLEGELLYWVKDNGVGFDMRYAHKLFGVFQRLHTDEQFEGTGVGLALVQRIIQRHGGRVWAESKLNAGATFYFALPIAAP